ncbi:asparagine synthase (glutamine-hydrolyzing) [Candidatus Kaiserbacteria bacterium]|nr:asparagine synthase (glutamine-hydrolyzing) [Candidatus Kaiserbacteria bacterium]
MCGIVGVWDKNKETTADFVDSMTKCLSHRGPDDSGYFADKNLQIHLSQRRLSIIDLSESGHQPMKIDDYVIAYNGEIYNYKEVKTELEKNNVVFNGDSDTEVLLRAWQQWGSASLDKFRGMFAFAIWDINNQELVLCRDRVGVKPLYLYQNDNLLIFASEIKAILAHPKVKRELDNEALQLFLQSGYVPAPYSIFKNIKKVLPSQLLIVDKEHNISSNTYWSPESLNSRHKVSADIDEATALNELENIIIESCSLRMIADVPVGVFLSGGIDSSLVTAVLKKQGYDNLSTFTIGFSENSHNEAVYAKAVAEHLGTKHHELLCTAKDAQEIIPKLPEMFDEPFADASAIPTYLLAQFARINVTAALSADGGDEIFGGYTRYNSGLNIYNKFKKLPSGIGWFILVVAKLSNFASAVGLIHQNKVHKFKKAHLYYKNRHSITDSYATQNSYFTDREVNQLLLKPKFLFLKDLYSHVSISSIKNHIRKLQRIDFNTYLPDDVLVKVDRASMSVGLEGREPLLDHHIIEYAAGLSDALLHKEVGNKYLLRQLLYKYIPRELVDRPKQGFGVPLNDWLKGDLSWLMDEYLEKDFIEKQGIFDYSIVENERQAFLSGAQPYNRIWNIIVFQMWYKRYLN